MAIANRPHAKGIRVKNNAPGQQGLIAATFTPLSYNAYLNMRHFHTSSIS